jgi:hypothetical protein
MIAENKITWPRRKRENPNVRRKHTRKKKGMGIGMITRRSRSGTVK